jgi:phosphate transport system permease protein
MQTSTLVLVLIGLAILGYRLGRHRALATVGGARGIRNLHSLPSYYGLLTAMWCAIPALIVVALWTFVDQTVITHLVVERMPEELRTLPADRLGLVMNDVRNVVNGAVPSDFVSPEARAAAETYRHFQSLGRSVIAVLALGVAIATIVVVKRLISPTMRARNRVERLIELMLLGCSLVAILTTIGIVLSVLFESIRFFHKVPITEFLFGLKWSPQTAIRADQIGSSGAFGAVPLFTGTLLISGIALLVAVPIGLFAAIYLAEYARPWIRRVVKPVLEILAGIPTVVYGFFAALTVGPMLRGIGDSVGLAVASESALAAGLVMGIMIVPFVSSLADDMITAVPQSLRDGAYALGATQSETVKQVVLPAALPGIVGGVLLAASRAIGETMIVVMAAGLAANLTINPLEAVTTVTVQIVTLLVGDQEFDSPKTLAAFALGLMLFAVTLLLNIIALHVVRKYREQYE